MKESIREVSKEEWEKTRAGILTKVRKLSTGGKDPEYFYTGCMIPKCKNEYCKTGAVLRYPRGYSYWFIRHFSEVGCLKSLEIWAKTPVTCLLRSTEGKHYISKHLPGFCPIHKLLIGKRPK